mgnify:CR=1 FL=1
MKKIISTVVGFLLLVSFSAKAQEELSIEKQLVGIVGAISGTVKTETRELKAGDKILRVNGKDASNKTTEELSSILKGTPNTQVNITIERGELGVMDFSFNRKNETKATMSGEALMITTVLAKVV